MTDENLFKSQSIEWGSDNDNPPEDLDANSKIERYKQIVKGSKEEAIRQKARADKLEQQNIKNATDKVQSDPLYIKSLYEEDPELANKVASNFEWFDTAEDLLKALPQIKSNTPKKSQEEIIADLVIQKLWHKKATSTIEDRLNSFPEAERKLVKQEFDFLSEWRSNLTEEQANALLERATLFTQKDKTFEKTKNKNMAQFSSIGFTPWSLTPKTRKEDWQGLAEAMWFKGLY